EVGKKPALLNMSKRATASVAAPAFAPLYVWKAASVMNASSTANVVPTNVIIGVARPGSLTSGAARRRRTAAINSTATAVAPTTMAAARGRLMTHLHLQQQAAADSGARTACS